MTGALTRAAGEAPGTYAITQGTLAANLNYTMASTGNTLVITASPPPPPPAGISIAPIANQFNRDGDDVDLQVVVVRGVTSALSAASRNSTVAHDEAAGDNEHDRGGVFLATGLPGGLEIDKDARSAAASRPTRRQSPGST